MVQRKPADKLGIQAETKNGIKSEKKPSSQHQDVRSRGSDHLIKKMKKARSFKLSNTESKVLRKENSRFNKLSVDVSASATPPRKPSPGRVSNGSLSPNYMKPTSSSDARKEGLQVSPKSQIHDKSRSPKGQSSFKSSSSGQKSVKLLRRNSSLKPIRPSMKKSSGITLYPKHNVGRATCSSTLKDTKFPDYVELNPGGTELEGTSVMKVCPYTYCSLNGHHHEPLPPLKRFLSAKRRLLRAQKSFKFRGISAPKKEKPWEGKLIDTGQTDFNGDIIVDADMAAGSVIHMFEDEDSDFFVEIYAKPKAEDIEADRNSGPYKVSDDPEDIMLIGDYEMTCGFSECGGTEDGGNQEQDDVNRANISTPASKDNDISAFLTENYKCVDQVQGLHADEAEAESLCDCECGLDGEFPPEELDSEASNMDWEDKISLCSDDDGFDSSAPYGDDFVLKSSPFPGEPTEAADILEDDADEKLLFPDTSFGESESGDAPFLDDSQLCAEVQVSVTCGDKAFVEVTAEDQEKMVDEKNEELEQGNIVLSELHVPGCLEEPTQTDDIVSESSVNTDEDDDDSLKGNSQLDGVLSIVSESNVDVEEEDDDDDSLKGYLEWNGRHIVVTQFPVDAEEDDNDSLNDESKGEQGLSTEYQSVVQDEVGVEENPLFPELQEADVVDADNESKAASSTEENSEVTEQGIQLSASVGQLDVGNIAERPASEVDQTGLKEYREQDGEESEDHRILLGNGIRENDTMEIEISIGGTEEDDIMTTDTESEVDESRTITKGVYKRKNRRSTEVTSSVKDFNPRPPRFLPLEPDPEAEKVDLRHQMMDERKNSEEWMIDYALQQTLNKLAPARKKRVALLVEAFETVIPIPKCETHLQGSAAGFPHIRHIQACS